MDHEKLIKQFIAVEFRHFMQHYQNAVDLSQPINNAAPARDGRQTAQQFATFAIDIGSRAGFVKRDLLGIMNRNPIFKTCSSRKDYDSARR